MSRKLISRSTTELTKQHVMDAQDAPELKGERSKKRGRLNRIVDWLDTGNFVRADIAYCFCKETGKRYRVNGQHSTAVLKECITNREMPDFPVGVPLVLEEWECDTFMELVEVFDSFDNPGAVRSSDDKLGVYISNYPDLDSVCRVAVKAALGGVNTSRKYHDNPDYPSRTAREVGTLLRSQEVRDYCKFIADFGNCVYDGWKKPGINAAVYDTWKECPGLAAAVWEEVFSESNPDPMSQSRIFVTKLRTSAAKKGKPSDFFYRSCMTQWKQAKRQTA